MNPRAGSPLCLAPCTPSAWHSAGPWAMADDGDNIQE